jgi:acetyl esterase/lipase
VRRALVPAIAVLALVLASSASGKPKSGGKPPFDVPVRERIVYGQGLVNEPAREKVDLLADLYKPIPRSKRRRPAVVLIHGGGFRGGTRTQPDLETLARGLAERGKVVLNIDYRLFPQDPVPSSRVAPAVAAIPPGVPLFNGMVAAIDDALKATKWLRKHRKGLKVHPRRLGIAGGSAGAITADHVAYALDDLGIKAPSFRFVGNLWGGIFIPLAGGAGAAADQLERGEAALFAVHGSADTTVPVTFSDLLVARAEAMGVPNEYHRVEGAGHGFGATEFHTREVAPGQTAFDRMLDFADRALRGQGK